MSKSKSQEKTESKLLTYTSAVKMGKGKKMAEEVKEVVEETTEKTEETEKELVVENPFKPIETQEALDAIIKDRLGRERKKGTEATAELQQRLDASIAENEALKAESAKSQKIAQENAELKAKVKKYETDSVKTRVSLEMGIPAELATRLMGETEEEIKADAEIFVKSLPKPTRTAPQRSTERTPVDADVNTVNDKGGLMDMLAQMNNSRR